MCLPQIFVVIVIIQFILQLPFLKWGICPGITIYCFQWDLHACVYAYIYIRIMPVMFCHWLVLINNCSILDCHRHTFISVLLQYYSANGGPSENVRSQPRVYFVYIQKRAISLRIYAKLLTSVCLTASSVKPIRAHIHFALHIRACSIAINT